MHLINLLRTILIILLQTSLSLTTYLYLYPLFHHCSFASPDSKTSDFANTLYSHLPLSQHIPTKLAPFRLLALGDPQLEGDTSLPDANAPSFPHLTSLKHNAFNQQGKRNSFIGRIRQSLHDLIDLYFEDVPGLLDGYRKRIDLFGNDYYLAHIYRTLSWWTRPTHVSVLGDLLGSQWIDDREFATRSHRFWNRAFRGGQRLPDDLMEERDASDMSPSLLGEDSAAWSKRIINIAGNHDIGYGGDLDEARIARFEKEFGKVNYELRFQLPMAVQDNVTEPSDPRFTPQDVPELRIVVLNSMNLDTPVGSQTLQDETYDFLNKIITSSHLVSRPAHFTLVLTHIPLYKPSDICVDAPFFDFFSEDSGYAGGVREQNHLSLDASKSILEGVLGMSGDIHSDGQGIGRNGIVINGHDHEGCDIYHFINQAEPKDTRGWQVTRIEDSQALDKRHEGVPGVREVTLRAMMGEYGGNAGLLSLWFDTESWEWQYAFENCALGKQHIWWATHIVDLITLIIGCVWAIWKLLSDAGLVSKGEFRVVDIWRSTTVGSSRKTVESSKQFSREATSVTLTDGVVKHEHRRFRSEGHIDGKRRNSLVFRRVE